MENHGAAIRDREKSHINALPFFFPIQIEPDYDAFRVDFCDRFLAELYATQRKRRIDELKNSILQGVQTSKEIVRNNDSIHRGDIKNSSKPATFPSSNTSVSGELPRLIISNPPKTIQSSTNMLKDSVFSPVTTPITICTSNLDNNDRSYISCPTFLRSPPLSLFRSPSTGCSTSSVSCPVTSPFPTSGGSTIYQHSTGYYSTTTTANVKTSSGTLQSNNNSSSAKSLLSTEELLTGEIEEKYMQTPGAAEFLSNEDYDHDDDEDLVVAKLKSPALRYGRNSGYRRLEDMKRRIQASFSTPVVSFLEEEIVWELRLYGLQKSRSSISKESPLGSLKDSFRETKMFFFGNKWWTMHFGVSANDRSISDTTSPTPCFYFHVSPAESVAYSRWLSLEFTLYPPVVVNGKYYVPLPLYRRFLEEDAHFPAIPLPPPSTTASSSSLIAGSVVMCGFYDFISLDELREYINEETGKVKLSVTIRSGIGRQGELVGRMGQS